MEGTVVLELKFGKESQRAIRLICIRLIFGCGRGTRVWLTCHRNTLVEISGLFKVSQMETVVFFQSGMVHTIQQFGELYHTLKFKPIILKPRHTVSKTTMILLPLCLTLVLLMATECRASVLDFSWNNSLGADLDEEFGLSEWDGSGDRHFHGLDPTGRADDGL